MKRIHFAGWVVLLAACSSRSQPAEGARTPEPSDLEQSPRPHAGETPFRVRCFEGTGSFCLLEVDGYLVDPSMPFVPACESAGAEEIARWPAEVEAGGVVRTLSCDVGEPLPDGVRCWRRPDAPARCHVAGAGFVSATTMGHVGPLPACMRTEDEVSERDALLSALAALRQTPPPGEEELAQARRLRPGLTLEQLTRERRERIEGLAAAIAELEEGSVPTAQPCESGSPFLSCVALETAHLFLGGTKFYMPGNPTVHPADAYVGELLSEGTRERSGRPPAPVCDEPDE